MIALVVFLKEFYPLGVDWQETYSQIPDHWRDPYEIASFTSPPWIMVLLPHAWLPVDWGNAINLVLNITLIVAVVVRFGGGWPLMLLVFTSPPFLDLVRTNNVDWIALLALLIPVTWGLPVLVGKPQALGGASLIWWKHSANKIRVLIPLVVVVVLSFLIWGLWPLRIKPVHESVWNFAPWPFLIPLGIYMLYRAYRQDDVFLAAAATPFLVPYIAPYSVAGLIAFCGSKYRREALIIYVAFWVYFIVETRRLGILLPE
ncbi:MAG: hypothetical protein AMJ56_19780 [Anaerolineae bacterium SG8_19]|nr:MAG: hypothetical protein AMJ56_19780 [Anaerolineae bacterium SG8_19]